MKKILSAAAPWILISLIYGILALTGHGCPIRLLTGIPCPGCGLSRAWLSFLHLDVVQAFRYHPLFWGIPLLLVFHWRWSDNGSPAAEKALFLLCALFILVYLIRLIIKDPVVSVNIQEGIIYRVFRFLQQLL